MYVFCSMTMVLKFYDVESDDIIIFLKNSKKKYASITKDEKNILMSNYLQPLLIKEKENVEHELCKMYIHKEWFDLYFNVTKIII